MNLLPLLPLLAITSKTDLLGIDILSKKFAEVTYALVESAVPPIRMTSGTRAFVGSRGSVTDTSFNDAGEDAMGIGFPPPLTYVFNQTNIAEGGSPLPAGQRFVCVLFSYPLCFFPQALVGCTAASFVS